MSVFYTWGLGYESIYRQRSRVQLELEFMLLLDLGVLIRVWFVLRFLTKLGVWFFPNSFCSMTLIPDSGELELDQESYPNSTWNKTVDRILRHGLWFLIQISCGVADTWVPGTCLSQALAGWVDSQSRDVYVPKTQSECTLCHIFSGIT
jgi:hypothetical protein